MKKILKTYNGTAIISFTKEEIKILNIKIGDILEIVKPDEK